eukprot:TRINITY_DN5640_c0_g1_i14.p1 TRINITY_DN5640_c0_g1~~TRINITY_DN5640_c0_g1_i14.p1  ORF type:complete len:506 (-),score=90.52 TRINITY_DN5640_c0_g1_i14:1208-2686(-)
MCIRDSIDSFLSKIRYSQILTMANLSTNDKDFILKALRQGLRLDGRELLDQRKIDVVFGLESGQVELSLGNTMVYAKVSAKITEPRKERPNEGFIRFNVDLSILNFSQQANSIYKANKYATEINKLLERIIKGSKALDVESLCILTLKYVWAIDVDIQLMNNDGNLIDAIYLAAIMALLHFRKPHVSIESNNQIKIHDRNSKKPQPLSIHHIPLTQTFAFFDKSESVVLDPSKNEEEIMEGRITVSMNVYKDICGIHKPGGASLSPEIIIKLVDVCSTRVVNFTSTVRQLLAKMDTNNLKAVRERSKICLTLKESDIYTLNMVNYEPSIASKENSNNEMDEEEDEGEEYDMDNDKRAKNEDDDEYPEDDEGDDVGISISEIRKTIEGDKEFITPNKQHDEGGLYLCLWSCDTSIFEYVCKLSADSLSLCFRMSDQMIDLNSRIKMKQFIIYKRYKKSGEQMNKFLRLNQTHSQTSSLMNSSAKKSSPRSLLK